MPFDGLRLSPVRKSQVGPDVGTGVKVVTMHHDISTITGEEVVLFTLARSPDFREAKMK